MSSIPTDSNTESKASADVAGTEPVAPIDVHALMERVRSLVAETLATPREKFSPLSVAPQTDGSGPVAGELLHSSELRLINKLHAFSLDVDPGRIQTSHRGGFFGRLITGIKRKLLVLIRDSLLADYLRAEHEFQSAVTKYLNTMTRYIDQRDSSDFWKLVHKIDVDTRKSVERIDRIADELEGSLATLRSEVNRRELPARRGSLIASPGAGPIAVTPAMSPQIVACVNHLNALSERLDRLEQRLANKV